MQSDISNAPSPKHVDIPTIRAMIGMDATPLISTFYGLNISSQITVSKVARERSLNFERLCELVGELHPLVRNALK